MAGCDGCGGRAWYMDTTYGHSLALVVSLSRKTTGSVTMGIKYADPSMPLEERCERLNAALNQALDQKEALEAKLAGVQAKLDGLMDAFEQGGSLGVLQAIAHDPIEATRRLGVMVTVSVMDPTPPKSSSTAPRAMSVHIVGKLALRSKLRRGRVRPPPRSTSPGTAIGFRSRSAAATEAAGCC
jgi:hypothetical protein